MRMFSVLLTVCFSLAFAIALPQKSNPNAIRVNKCCEKFELLVDAVCTNLNDSAAESSGTLRKAKKTIPNCFIKTFTATFVHRLLANTQSNVYSWAIYKPIHLNNFGLSSQLILLIHFYCIAAC